MCEEREREEGQWGEHETLGLSCDRVGGGPQEESVAETAPTQQLIRFLTRSQIRPYSTLGTSRNFFQ